MPKKHQRQLVVLPGTTFTLKGKSPTSNNTYFELSRVWATRTYQCRLGHQAAEVISQTTAQTVEILLVIGA